MAAATRTTMAGQVTAIVVAYDSAAVLPDCLTALERQGAGIIVVDNASLDNSVKVAQSHGALVIRNDANEGYGRGNNMGVSAATTPYVLICNPDLILDGGALVALLAAAERYPDAAMLAPRIVEPSGRVFFQDWSLLAPKYLNQARRNSKGGVIPAGDVCAPFLSGACLMIRREVFNTLGGFDPNIFLFYEDDDLCHRVLAAGHSLVHVHEARAVHGRGISTAPKKGRKFTARWHLAWSHAYISAKYGRRSPALWGFVKNTLQTIGWRLWLRPDMVERHWGSAIGYMAWMRGRSALKRQGLE
jgi:N-acetylglucosaminyl-diphospho-decaprenol L-rhamnosyltransferase